MLSRPLCRGSAHKIGSLFPCHLNSSILRNLLASYFGLVKSSCGLITLPQEVLEMILADLDWKDVLNVRVVSASVAELPSFSDTLQTCKLLCTASRSRSVWRAQYQRVSDSYDTPLNTKDRTTTYAELERDSLHWARLQHSWGSRPKPTTQRLVCECSAIQIHLVHGGRWLLATTKYPCLDFYDLDSPNGQRRILTRPQDKREQYAPTIAVDEANTAPPNVDMFIALSHETTRVFAISILLYSITHPHQTSSS